MPIEVLLVEDSPGDVRLTQEAFRDANAAIRLHVAIDGVEAMAFLRQRRRLRRCAAPGPHPAGSQPAPNGWPRGADSHQGGREPEDDPDGHPDDVRRRSGHRQELQLQANCYLSKPVQLDAFEDLVKSINDFWLPKVRLPRQAEGA